MAEKSTGFETGTHGAVLATGDTGDPTAYDFVSWTGTGWESHYDNTRVLDGSLSCKTQTSASKGGFFWDDGASPADTYGRVYANIDAAPSVEIVLVSCDVGSGAYLEIQLGTDLKLNVQTNSEASTCAFSTACATDQWIRIEWHLVCGDPGSCEVKLFNTASSSTADETQADASIATLGFGLVSIGIGIYVNGGGTSTQGPIWYDACVSGATSYPGPIATDVDYGSVQQSDVLRKRVRWGR